MRSGWRLASIGAVFLGLFAILLLRMWYLQVTNIETAIEAAGSQQVRPVTIEAPRGDILDRDGTTLMAATRASLQIVVDRALIPAEQTEQLIQSLAALLGRTPADIRQVFEDRQAVDRFSVGGEISEETALFTLEHIEDFPGVTVEPLPVRVYPLGESAAHIVGYIGAPGESDLRRDEITVNDRVGKFGLEREYDRLLRGRPGKITYQVNSSGQVLGILDEVLPEPGGSLVTTVDMDTQRVLESSLSDGFVIARQNGEPVVRAAGLVLDATDGSVVAMASLPSFDPSLFSDGRITQSEWEAISTNYALNNFAIQGLYPPASAFKPIPYTLAIENGVYPKLENVYQDEAKVARYSQLLDPNDETSFYADGLLLFPETPPLRDWSCGALLEDLTCSLGGHGLVNIHSALTRSSNQYFWGIALEIWNARSGDVPEDLLQQWSRELGFGAETGIDLPFEQSGLVPDREWFQYNQLNQTGLVRAEGGWSGGDVMNIAIGQGALSVTPLQLANAYAALVNGGTLWRPRVVDSIRDSNNQTIYTNPPSPLAMIDISPSTVASLVHDLNGVVTEGTAKVAFADFGPGLDQVGGKTGTGQIGQTFIRPDGAEEDVTHSWFVGVAPLDDPKWIVAIVIDQGGSGGQVAAPTARRVMQFLMGGEEQMTPVRSGEDTER